MPSENTELLKRLLATFKVEAREHVDALALRLVELENAATKEAQVGMLDVIFRHAHSLKGAARAVNVANIEAICQALENIFAGMKRQAIVPSAELFDFLHQAVAMLGTLLEQLETTAPASVKPRVSALIRSLQNLAAKKSATSEPVRAESPDGEAPVAAPAGAVQVRAEEKRSVVDATVRVSTAKLDTVLRQAEEMLSFKQAAMQHAAKLNQVHRVSSQWKEKWARLRPDIRLAGQSLQGRGERNGRTVAGPHLARIMEFLDWNRDFVETLQSELADLSQGAVQEQRTVTTMVDNLLDEMKKVVMQPFSTMLEVLPRFVRELSRDQGKEVNLSIQGGEIEIDRRILEEMKDPLIHLVRNCLDHGIESPAERMRQGKPARGKVTIDITARSGSRVELLVADDGRGIDADKVRSAAGKLRLLSPKKAEALDDREALPLIFQSGISTSPIITDISGRGLGLAIVKEKVEKLNGTLSVETKINQGTHFQIILPLTLSRFHGVTVRLGDQLFVLPTSQVERVTRIRKAEIKTVENRETIAFNGQAISFVHLHQVLGIGSAPQGLADIFPAIVLAAANQRIAFAIDEVLHEHEVLVKPLGPQLVRLRNIASATVMGNGRVVPILNVPDLIQAAIHLSQAGASVPEIPVETTEVRKKSILIAEDSITSRTLLKNILETAGYRVETSVDGIDAFTKLCSGEFDLVVSDVDMPRMNGFGLTAKIRADKKFSELPVVLVTALDSREDREHGIDVGANAYIVKGSFDQSNLLEVIRQSI